MRVNVCGSTEARNGYGKTHQQRQLHSGSINGILTNPILTRIEGGGGRVGNQKAFNTASKVAVL